ncbi:MAG: peptidylprolyl isomerase [Pirellulaceae bacterium]
MRSPQQHGPARYLRSCSVWSALAVLLMATTAARAADEAEQRVVAATVEGQPIYTQHVERMIGRALSGRSLKGKALAELRARALEQLISRRVILAYLQEQKAAASQQDVELELAKIKKQLAQQDLTLEKYLQQGRFLDQQDLHETLAWQISWQRYLERMTTDDNLEKHFERNRAQFDGTQLEAAHIVFKVEPRDDAEALAGVMDLARSVRADILAGKTTFADQARRHSIAPTSEQGGRIGRISRHGSLPESVADAAFQLADGEITLPTVSTFGVHLVQCLKTIPGQSSFSTVRDAVEADARRFLFDWIVSQRRANSRVEYTGAAPYLDPGTMQVVAP